MTQEDKKLLLKDICARLPYNIEVEYNNVNCEVLSIDTYNEELTIRVCPGYSPIVKLENVKPYLFPMSSMTEEQKNECFKGTPLEIDKYGGIAVKDDLYGGSLYTDLEIYLEVIVWLLKNHFDIYDLIPKGLAIDATGLNIY